jgi:G:T-mismatch repair DNA endonuclease (very short patch repair protein)
MSEDQDTIDRGKVLAKHAQELAELEISQAIRRALPDLGLPFKIHVGDLYGTAALVYLEFDFFGQAKPQPDLDTVAKLGAALPGVPLVFMQNGCAWFQSREYLDSLPPDHRDGRGTVTPVCPFHVRLSAFQQHTATFTWIARVAGRLVRVEVKIPTPLEIGYIHASYQDIPGRRMLVSCIFKPGPKLRDLPSAKLASPLKFAAGGEDTPNAFEVYYTGSATVVDFVNMIRG